MSEDEKFLLKQIDERLTAFSKDIWRLDARIELLNTRIATIGGWLLFAAWTVVFVGTIYALKFFADDAFEVAGFIAVGLAIGCGIYTAAKSSFHDKRAQAVARREWAEPNADREKRGLPLLRDSTALRTVFAFISIYVVGAIILGIVGGVGAILVDLIFLSHSLGQVAQWGVAGVAGGLAAFLIISVCSDAIALIKKMRRRT